MYLNLLQRQTQLNKEIVAQTSILIINSNIKLKAK